jgi:hypothetical protein
VARGTGIMILFVFLAMTAISISAGRADAAETASAAVAVRTIGLYPRDNRLCRLANEGFAQAQSWPLLLWRIPFAPNAEVTEPAWVQVNYLDHVEVIKEIFLRYELELTLGAIQSGGAIPSLAEGTTRVWEPLAPRILGSFARGEARIEKSQFDLNNNGITDIVYRMTDWTVEPFIRAAPNISMTERTVRFSGPDPTVWPLNSVGYRYFAPLQDNPSNPNFLEIDHLIRWMFLFGGQTYYFLDLNIARPTPLSLFRQTRSFMEPVCSFERR